MLTACESTKTRNNMRGGADAWKEIKGEKEGRAKKYYDMAAKDKERYKMELANEIEKKGRNIPIQMHVEDDKNEEEKDKEKEQEEEEQEEDEKKGEEEEDKEGEKDDDKEDEWGDAFRKAGMPSCSMMEDETDC